MSTYKFTRNGPLSTTEQKFEYSDIQLAKQQFMRWQQP